MIDALALTRLKGVGPKLAEQLSKLGIHTLVDLAFHLPFRYEDRSRITPIGQLMPQRPAVIQGDVVGASVVFGKRRSLLVKLKDGSGAMSLRFYHFSAAQKRQFESGVTLRCFGEPRRGASGLELYHPEYQLIDERTEHTLPDVLTPIYPATEGISQQRLRVMIEQMCTLLLTDQLPLDDLLPNEWCAKWHLPPLKAALLCLHQPPSDTDVDALLQGQHPAQRRLILEELLAHQLSLHRVRSELQATPAATIDASQCGQMQQRLLAALAFTPTNAQQRVAADILTDLAKPYPMLRLVQGDVGSGKTLVAAMAACAALEAGWQVAFMAPTEILAEQHHQNLRAWFEPLGVQMGWLAGKLKGRARTASLAAIAEGHAQLVVGTHALFQPEVHFSKLALVIVDEQHRFGVGQRLMLRDKGAHAGLAPHQLTMTATPIPRTLAMSEYGDLDVSVIDELPPGRSPITTVTVSDSRRSEVIERVASVCAEGRQAYWVCTLIEESESLQCQAAEDTLATLQSALGQLRIGLVHGRMKPADKAHAMAQFKAHELDVLVATTVIEVGVDVPNASLMIIENPERLGLAQLHQLRGRVGRGAAKSYCVLLYGAALSQIGRERLQVMRDSQDGFYIAEQDLLIRGPGELLGTRQTGLQSLRIADLTRDGHLLPDVRTMAEQLWHHHPSCVAPLIDRWLGDAEQFAQV